MVAGLLTGCPVGFLGSLVPKVARTRQRTRLFCPNISPQVLWLLKSSCHPARTLIQGYNFKPQKPGHKGHWTSSLKWARLGIGNSTLVCLSVVVSFLLPRGPSSRGPESPTAKSLHQCSALAGMHSLSLPISSTVGSKLYLQHGLEASWRSQIP